MRRTSCVDVGDGCLQRLVSKTSVYPTGMSLWYVHMWTRTLVYCDRIGTTSFRSWKYRVSHNDDQPSVTTQTYEYGFFLLIGVSAGLLGAVFVTLHEKFVFWRKNTLSGIVVIVGGWVCSIHAITCTIMIMGGRMHGWVCHIHKITITCTYLNDYTSPCMGGCIGIWVGMENI